MPGVADFNVGALDGGPGDAVRGLFLANVAGVGGISVIERLVINILSVGGKMAFERKPADRHSLHTALAIPPF